MPLHVISWSRDFTWNGLILGISRDHGMKITWNHVIFTWNQALGISWFHVMRIFVKFRGTNTKPRPRVLFLFHRFWGLIPATTTCVKSLNTRLLATILVTWIYIIRPREPKIILVLAQEYFFCVGYTPFDKNLKFWVETPDFLNFPIWKPKRPLIFKHSKSS